MTLLMPLGFVIAFFCIGYGLFRIAFEGDAGWGFLLLLSGAAIAAISPIAPFVVLLPDNEVLIRARFLVRFKIPTSTLLYEFKHPPNPSTNLDATRQSAIGVAIRGLPSATLILLLLQEQAISVSGGMNEEFPIQIRGRRHPFVSTNLTKADSAANRIAADLRSFRRARGL